MKEKELRLALVVFGGVSLAVYMHGVTKEVQKLLRASKILHGVRDEAARQASTYDQLNDDPDRETDSERLYFEFLKRINQTISLRVLVDIIAGASAGGINGIFLARAIAEDLPLDPLRKLWLENADVERLLDPDAASTKWSKFYMRPLVWLYGKTKAARVDELVAHRANAELRQKLSLFVRSRWFAAPFSGHLITRYIHDALEAMGKEGQSMRSLLPPGLPLDLFVTVTDLQGYEQSIRLHSPSEIVEREHRLVISFHDAGFVGRTERLLGSLPALTFAARATSSFPGAFPPARISDIDHVLKVKNLKWPDREAFLKHGLSTVLKRRPDPASAPFIDGSVLNNKPFGEAIAALKARPAHREVDRRIVYVEPKPMTTDDTQTEKSDRFFSVIRASLSDIPRNQPIRDDLEWVDSFSRRVRRFRRISDEMRSLIEEAVEEAIGHRLMTEKLTPDLVAQWRAISHELVERESGFAYWAYADMKVVNILEEMSGLLAMLADQPGRRASNRLIDAVFEWARMQDILPLKRPARGMPISEDTPWVRFLSRFDLSYRIRRLRYVIRNLNGLYAVARSDAEHRGLDKLKSKLYAALNPLLKCRQPDPYPEAMGILAAQPTADQCAVLMHALSVYLNLDDQDDAVDTALIEGVNAIPSPDIRRALIIGYIGFTFVDVASLPMLQGEGLDEFDEIKVDRMSPQDATTIRKGGATATLKGLELGSFGAFFSRAYRENDYLWGRLHAADRLVDIVLSSVTADFVMPQAEIRLLKRRLFESILTAEASHLRYVPGLIDQIRSEIEARLGTQHPDG